MTIPEIKSLKDELEDALQTAFADFKRLSGVDIKSIDLVHVVYANLCDRHDRHLTAVKVNLEPL